MQKLGRVEFFYDGDCRKLLFAFELLFRPLFPLSVLIYSRTKPSPLLFVLEPVQTASMSIVKNIKVRRTIL